MGNATVKQRYLDHHDNVVIEEVDDPDGRYPVPVRDSVIFLGGRRYQIVRVSFNLDTTDCLLMYDALVREIS